MDDFLDRLWNQIVAGLNQVASLMDRLLAPLDHWLGPAAVIFLLVVALVALTKLLTRVYSTKRHRELKAEYEHWYHLRQEAMRCEDREKGAALARNIDQAKLNKAYYDYFFEGLLKSIITTIVPILFMAAYVGRAYGPERLIQRLGREGLFEFARSGQPPILIGTFFWFVICLVLVHLLWATIAARIKHRKR